MYLFLGFFLIPLFAFAQDLVTSPPTGEDLNALLQSILSLKGAGSLLIASVAIQAGMLVARFSLQGKNHKHLIPILLLLSLGVAVVEGLIAGRDWTSIIFSSVFLAGLQNFGFSVYNQYFKKA
jgi:hypothetical protein